MSHVIIITTPPSSGGGGSFTANGSSAVTKVEWTPPHDLSPGQVARRIARAEELSEQINHLLNQGHED